MSLNRVEAHPARGDASLLANREALKANPKHWEAAPYFHADSKLLAAINVALAVRAPLLLTGEPGTGKTLVAYHLAWYFQLGADEPGEDGRPGWAQAVHALHVRSTSTWRDLLYDFDAVRYFREKESTSRAACVTPGPLWRAYAAQGKAIVLIDEVDKAPRDFPNDLLNVLDQGWFRVPEREEPNGPEYRVAAPSSPPPIIITSNSERQLPAPFLRRCIFHHIKLDEDLVGAVVEAHRKAGHFPKLDKATLEAGLARFHDIRKLTNLRKKPTTSELLLWFSVLNWMGADAHAKVRQPDLAKLEALSVLIKDSDDLSALQR